MKLHSNAPKRYTLKVRDNSLPGEVFKKIKIPKKNDPDMPVDDELYKLLIGSSEFRADNRNKVYRFVNDLGQEEPGWNISD